MTLAWLRARWPAVVLGLLGVPLGVVATLGTLRWPGRVFPGFFVMPNGLVPTVAAPAWTGPRAGVPFLAQVVAVDGRSVDGNAGVEAAIAGRGEGEQVHYQLRQGGQVFERVVATMRFGGADYWLTVGIFLVCGWFALGLGLVVGLVRPALPAARAFLLQGGVTGLYALSGTALYDPSLAWLAPLYLVTHAVLAATFVHLVLVFPVPRRFVERQPRWLAWPYVTSLVLAAWLLVGFYERPPDPTSLLVSFGATALGLLVFITVPIWTYRENRLPRVRPQLEAVIPGIVGGAAVALWAHVSAARAGGAFPLNLMALTVPLFYGSVAWAIVRHDLFDIDALVKQAIVYGALTVGVAGTHAAAVAMVSSAATSRAFNVAFLVVVAAAFEPARVRVQRVVDRVFYRRRADYRETVRQLAAALTTLLDPDEVLARVGAAVTDAFQIRSFAVLLWEPSGARVHAFGHTPRATAGVPRGLREVLDASGTQPLPLDPSVAPGDAVLAVPLRVGGDLTGAFLLGPRLSGRPFGREDLELLGTLAAQSAIALANARSYRALARLNADLEEQVRTRTTQLVQAEKMASLGVLVAGVAHEINNPVSFVVNNVEPLAEAIAEVEAAAGEGAREPLEAIREMVDLMGRGARRTAAIVNDLRAFSRMGEERSDPVDLVEAVELAVRLLRPRWAERVTIHRALEPLPPIPGASGQLNQVFMNLVANACDAVGEGGNIWVETHREDGRLSVTVRDDGPGIPPDVQARMFDPFFTTKPQGQGTGLGLSIAQAIVAAHGGRIRVESAPGQGTAMTVELPLSS